MKMEAAMAKATAVLGMVSLLSLVGYYLALHDILRDYASTKVLQEQAGLAAGALPDWTACSLEWRVIGVGFWPMLLFHIAFLLNIGWRAKSPSSDGRNEAVEAAR